MNRPLISVIVCTYNNARLLPYCLDSLVNQTLAKELCQVIIVNNNSKDNTQQIANEYVRNHSNFSLTTERKQGLSFARNKGWQLAQGKYVAFIDDDAKATPAWCQKIVDAFENVSPSPSAVGGPIYPIYETKPPKWFSDEFEIRSKGRKSRFLDTKIEKYGFSGSNMAFPRALLEKYGGFSTDYGLKGKKLRMGDEAEFFYRIHTKDPLFWYDPQIKVFHWTSANKMRLSYRLRRAYKSGKVIAQIEKFDWSFSSYWQRWGYFFLFLLSLLYRIPKLQENRKANHVKLLEQLALQLGLLSN